MTLLMQISPDLRFPKPAPVKQMVSPLKRPRNFSDEGEGTQIMGKMDGYEVDVSKNVMKVKRLLDMEVKEGMQFVRGCKTVHFDVDDDEDSF